MPVAGVTRLRLRRWRYVPLLILAAMRSRRQALASDGCLAADARTQGARVFWTRTLWRDRRQCMPSCAAVATAR